MPDPTIQQIEERVHNEEQAVEPIFKRMDGDWDLYNLAKFRPPQGDGIKLEDAYTSNRPKIVADKLSGAIAGAKQIIRVELDADNKDERETNNNYERFGIGVMKKANRLRVSAGGVPIITELGFRVITQGRYAAARALLKKDAQGETLPDVTVIHPRHLVIQMGSTEPIWAGIVTMRSRANVRDEYPDFKFDDEEKGEDDNQMTEKVIDYYWKQDGSYWNAVVIAGKWAKRKTDTFATQFPIIARAVGPHSGTSGISSLSQHADGTSTVPGIETFGESIFAPLRANNDFTNRLMSYKMAMAGKRVKNFMKIFSSDGTKELEAEIDEDATSASFSVDNQEDMVPLEIQDLGRDVDSLAQFTVNEAADGSLPEQSFGRLPAPISGNALAILGASVGERLEPFIRPVESCVEGIIEALAGQFETGRFKPMKLSGRMRSREPFSRPIEPADIEGHDDLSVELVPDLPTDRNETWLTAQVAATPGANGEPLASPLTIREDILQMQDADLEQERILASAARMSSPKIMLMTRMVAASRAGDEATVFFLQRELQRIMTREEFEEVAQQIAFMQLLAQSGIDAATSGFGEGAATSVNGAANGANGTSPNAFRGIRPEFAALTGFAPGSVNPAEEAGSNTTGPRETRFNAAGLTAATPEDIARFG